MTPQAALSLLERAEQDHKRALWRLAARALGEIVAAQAAQMAPEPREAVAAIVRQPEPKRPPAATQRPSLCDFLAIRGLTDHGGELSARDLDRRHRNKPFRRRLIREGGLGLERAAELAFDCGYFPECIAAEQVTVERLLGAMERELIGDFPRLQGVPVDPSDDYFQALEPEEREALGWERVA